METTIACRGNIGIMDKNMETRIEVIKQACPRSMGVLLCYVMWPPAARRNQASHPKPTYFWPLLTLEPSAAYP